MGFGRYFQELRRNLRFTLRDFCKEGNYSCKEGNFDPGVISRVERERSRPPQDDETLDAWADVLGLAPAKRREFKEYARADADMPDFIPLSGQPPHPKG